MDTSGSQEINYTKLDKHVVNFATKMLDYNWLVILTTLIVVIASAVGLKNYQMVTDFRVFFSDENPQLIAFNELEDTYVKNDVLLYVIAPKDGVVFNKEVLTAIEDITEESWKLTHSSRVDSITNFQHTYAEDDDLIVESLIEFPDSLSVDEIAQKKQIALDEPVLRDRLISSKADVTGINITFQMPDEDPQASIKSFDSAVILRDKMETKYPFLDIGITGFVAMDGAFFEASDTDAKTLMPGMFIAILVILGLLLRSFSATFVSLNLIIFSILIGMGISLWAGVKMTSASMPAPIMIMTLAVADCVHLYVTLLQGLGKGQSKREAIIESVRVNFMPVLLTSVTTAIGFLMMNFSDSPPFHDLGNITALGVMIAFVLAITFLPALTSVLPIKAKMRQDNILNRSMDKLADFVIRRNKGLLIGGFILSIIVLSFIPRNELNDEWVKYFSTDMEFRQDTVFSMENLTGIYQLSYSLKTNEAGGISEPEYLTNLANFKTWFEKQDGVLHVSSMSETFETLNKNMHGDDPAFDRTPENRKLAAQYLLLYEMSLPLGLDLNNRVDIDKSSTNFVVTTDQLSTNQIRALAGLGEQWLLDNAPEMATLASGGSVMFSHLSERNIKGMLRGTFLGVLLISFLLMFALRSVKMGVISLIPNLLPAGLAFGLWGLLVGQVNMASSIVTCMVLGIVVDDTVHFLSKYLRAKREQAMDTVSAIRFAFSSVGTALLVTTIILVCGFSILATSNFALNSSLARLTVIAIALALIVDFLLLPPLLMKLDSKPSAAKARDTNNTSTSTSELIGTGA